MYMNWKNLKSNGCPKCGEQLTKHDVARQHICECGYSIGFARFDEIVNSMYGKKKDYGHIDNGEGLNNWGHKKVSDDFSDSPHLNY